ncbi:MAG TPA: aldolase/citrate lyase family protein [Solirubrobacteraceae bacterium]|nr:aldolase/citrate lyase family protein [Solirubrobacteraceae bacterium]
MTAALTAMLYVPGGAQDKLDNIPRLHAKAYILDLEDAVAVSAKPTARRIVAAAIQCHGPAVTLYVRINSFESGLLHEDLQHVVVPGLTGIVLPKAQTAEHVQTLAGVLTALERERGLARPVEVIATIESAAALERAVEIGRASDRVHCLGFGAGDFSLDLGLEWPPPGRRLSATIVGAKAQLVLRSRVAELAPPHDGVFPDFKDLETLRIEAEEARALGFAGKHAIHPAQLPVIEEVFVPGEAELARARTVVTAFDRSEREGVANIHIDGRFIDYPVAAHARRRLAGAGEPVDGSAPAMPLAGVRVLDLSSLYAAPLIATNLGDFGAEVIKVEHPRGDDARRWGLAKDGVPLWWKVISRNKRVIALDLNKDADREVARRLAAQADVLIENFRPGRMEAWGLGPEDLAALNRRLVFVRMTGFGQTGPRSSQPGFGTLAEAFSGFAHITGWPDGPPTLPPFGLADGIAGLAGTFATMVALYWRDARHGREGQVIDLSLYEPLFSILGPQLAEYQHAGVVQKRQGNRSPRTAPRNAYETGDGRWVALSGGTQQITNRIFAAIGRPELAQDPRFADAAARRANADEVDRLVAEWIAARPLDEVLEAFAAVQAPIAPVYDAAQILEDPHYRARGSIVEAPDEDLGTIAMPGIVARLSRTPGVIRHTGPTMIGADTDAILEQLGLRRAPTAEEREP